LSRPFFPALVNYIVSGPVVAMVWEGKGVVLTGRKIIGATATLIVLTATDFKIFLSGAIAAYTSYSLAYC
jgi:nucleoside diphosphate kinase